MQQMTLVFSSLDWDRLHSQYCSHSKDILQTQHTSTISLTNNVKSEMLLSRPSKQPSFAADSWASCFFRRSDVVSKLVFFHKLRLSELIQNAQITVVTSCLGISRQRVQLALVPQNSTAQSWHHDANCPACVSLQPDDLVSTANISNYEKWDAHWQCFTMLTLLGTKRHSNLPR